MLVQTTLPVYTVRHALHAMALDRFKGEGRRLGPEPVAHGRNWPQSSSHMVDEMCDLVEPWLMCAMALSLLFLLLLLAMLVASHVGLVLGRICPVKATDVDI